MTSLDRLLPHAAFTRLATASARPRGTLLLGLGLFGLYLATASYGSVSADISASYLPAYTLAQHHTADLDGWQQLTIWVHQVDGHWRSDRFPGAILAAVPAYWLFGSPDGVAIGPAVLTCALLAALTVAVMHRTLLRIVGPGWALAGALVLGLGTSTWTVSGDGLWTHSVTQFGLSLALYGLASRRPWWGALGMLFSAAARPHTSVVAAVLGIGDALRTRRVWTAVALAAGTLAGFAVVLAWSGTTLGRASLLPGTYAGRGGDVATAGSSHGYGWPVNLAGFLVSPERGVLVLCPFIITCLVGVPRIWRAAPGWVRDAAIGAVVYSLVQLSANGFAGGWGFYSFRLALEPITLLTPLLVLGARSVCRRPRWAVATALLVGYSIAVHTLGGAWYVNSNEGSKWWSVYQPAQLTRAVPWHGVVAVLVAVFATAVVVGLARSDRSDEPGVGPDADVSPAAATT